MNQLTLIGLMLVVGVTGLYLTNRWLKSREATPIEPIQYELIIDPNQKVYDNFDAQMSGWWT